MTLSRWLRDYLYIPLGGNRKGTARTYLNLMITMLLGGLWHGAAWHFVAWGGLHGAYLAAGHWKDGKREAGQLAEPPDTLLVHWMQRLATFTLVCIGWTLFRADSVATALALLARTVTAWRLPSPLVTTPVLLAISAGLVTQFLPHRSAERLKAALSRLRPVPLGITVAVVLFLITTLGPRGVAPFIYFQF
jgi:D-alanyl-lipoteichoic acid acyltransferase DltB (MBOAT superfamily)